MPASAHHGDRATQAGAQVLDLAARRSRRRPASTSLSAAAQERPGPVRDDRDPAQVRDVVSFFEDRMRAEGVSLEDPSAAAAVRAAADILERVMLGARRLRNGDPERGIAPDPKRGLDQAGVDTMMQLVRDLRSAPDDLAAMRAVAREL